ncbi:MAG TPA: TonB family protein [Thermoanaerobaculia bacterium]|nr:TonB family protein [Thermoanaerobaculia bacterium]
MFETAARLSASGSLRTNVRVWSLPLSIALHGLAVGVAAWLSIQSAPGASDPPIPVVFLEGSAPPLPLGDQSGSATTTEVVRADRAERASETDVEDSDASASDETAADPSSEKDDKGTSDVAATPLGDPRGELDGRPGGMADSHGKDGPNPGDDERPYRPGGSVAEPRLVLRIEPPYPEVARKARIEGVVILQAIIGKNGNVEDLHLVKSANVLLDAAAMEAVSRWRYAPATLNGFAVRVYLTVTVEFRLR